MQRLRITFSRGGGAKYLSHLEMLKSWERVFRRVGWEVAHSQGFNPHPRVFFAAPLAVGVAAERDILEVHLETAVDLPAGRVALAGHLPPGLSLEELVEVDSAAPAPQKAVRAAEYRAECPSTASGEDLGAAISRVLGAASLPRARVKETKTVRYDLRPLIRDLRLEKGEPPTVFMTLRSDTQGAGRADEVLRELGLDPADCSLTRTRLVLEEEA